MSSLYGAIENLHLTIYDLSYAVDQYKLSLDRTVKFKKNGEFHWLIKQPRNPRTANYKSEIIIKIRTSQAEFLVTIWKIEAKI